MPIATRDRVTALHEQNIENKPLYSGELCTIHGKKEALEHIAMGKWKTTTDKQGTTMYKKVSGTETFAKRRERSKEQAGHPIDSSI